MEEKKILILSTNSKSVDRNRMDAEIREINEALRMATHQNQFEIKTELSVRQKDISLAVLENKPHIVHFCGFGNSQGITFEDSNGNNVATSPEAIASLFKLFSNHVECVVLNAGYSQQQATAISQYIPFVIGMRREITDKIAITFVNGFYDALGAGTSYEKAFDIARNALQFINPAYSFIPALNKQSNICPAPPLTENKEKEECPKKNSLFISYSKNDKAFAQKLINDLTKHGHTVWDAEIEIKVGDLLVDKTREGIDFANFFIILISKFSIESEWVKHELNTAMIREIEEKRVVILPIILDQVTLPGFLKGKKYGDFIEKEKYQENFLFLLKSLNR